jgi:hypothetical protein
MEKQKEKEIAYGIARRKCFGKYIAIKDKTKELHSN